MDNWKARGYLNKVFPFPWALIAISYHTPVWKHSSMSRTIATVLFIVRSVQFLSSSRSLLHQRSVYCITILDPWYKASKSTAESMFAIIFKANTNKSLAFIRRQLCCLKSSLCFFISMLRVCSLHPTHYKSDLRPLREQHRSLILNICCDLHVVTTPEWNLFMW